MNTESSQQNFYKIDNAEEFDFDELERILSANIEEQLAELDSLKKDEEKIGNPDALGEVVMQTVIEQFNNQIAVTAGKDFIIDNNGLTLDIRDEAHIQTTENFAEGKISTHNTEIDYQKRYDDWQSNFEHDESGNVKTHTTRTGKTEANLAKGARKPFDQGRPKGSKEKGTDYDHTVSAGEIIRDPAANAHMTKEEQIKFANSDVNLNEMDSSQNRSKGDLSTKDWLNNTNSKGQKPEEIFNMTEKEKKKLLKKDKEARAEYERLKKESEQKSIEAGKKSQKQETLRITGKALRAAIMAMLADLLKEVIWKLIAWLKKGKRTFEELGKYIKDAVKNFFSNFKERVMSAGQNVLLTVLSALGGIYKRIVDFFNKIGMMLKQGWKSIKQAYNYLKSEEAKKQPLSVLIMQVSKIFVTGLSAVGAIALSKFIEGTLMTIPVFAIEIPLIGSIASIIGLFMGALTSGIAGAIVINFIDKLIANKLKSNIVEKQIDASNEILKDQKQLEIISKMHNEQIKNKVAVSIKDRHEKAAEIMKDVIERMTDYKPNYKETDAKDVISDNEKDFDDMDKVLKSLGI